MSRLTAKQRRRIPKSKFGLPGKAPGHGSYPMPDKAHARVAKAYATRFATPSQKAQIDAKANRILHEGSSKPQKNAFDRARAYLKRIKGR